jgi:hypothetical protein
MRFYLDSHKVVKGKPVPVEFDLGGETYSYPPGKHLIKAKTPDLTPWHVAQQAMMTNRSAVTIFSEDENSDD